MVDELQIAVEQAVRAPSSHNTQPWSFRVEGNVVGLYADVRRRLPSVDSEGRELVISCGAALFTLEVAIAHLGYEPQVDVLPDPQTPELIAMVTAGPDRPPSEPADKLFKAIPYRRTKARADVIQFKDKAFRHELAARFRPNSSRRSDGMPGYALGFGGLSSRLATFAVRWFDLGRSQAAKSRRLLAASPLLGAIVTDGDEARDWVRAGRALQRVLLLATVEGVSVSFLNQAVEVPELRKELWRLIGPEGSPQLLLRFGYAPQVRPAPRRPLAEVLVA
jgi:nitroreductase